jgi:exonuclease VII large subunit
MFPSLPTDNLYKFLALSGVVILLFSAYFMKTRVLELEDQVEILKAEKQIGLEKIRSIEECQKNLENIINNSIAEQTGKLKKDKNKLELQYSDTEIKQIQRELHETMLEQRIEAIKTTSKAKRLSQLIEQSSELVNWGSLCVGLGVFLANIGFLLWYKKVQKPLDLRMQMELQRLQTNPQQNTDGSNQSAG